MAVTLGYGGLQSVPDKQDTARIIFKQPPKKSSGSKKGGSGGSSGGSSTRQSTIAGVQAEAQRIAAQAEAAKQAEIQKQIAAEKARIQAEINKLNLVRAYKSRDVKSGVTSDVKEYKNGSKIIREFTERDTGITRYERYGAGRGGGSRQFQESFSFQDRFTAQQNKNIRDELNLAGLVPLSTNGQVTGFLSKITGKRYDYSDKGIEKFNKDLAVKGMIQDVENFKGGIREIIKTIPPKLKIIPKYLSKGDEIYSKIKGKVFSSVSKFYNTADSWSENIAKRLDKSGVPVSKIRTIPRDFYRKIRTQLKNSKINTQSITAYQQEMNRVRNQQIGKLESLSLESRRKLAEVSEIVRANPNLTDKQIESEIKRQMSRDSVKKAVQGVGLLGQTIAFKIVDTAISLGVATPTLIKQIKDNPLLTISMLPSAVLEGFKQDIRTIRTGEGLGFIDVVVEYHVLSKIFGVARGITKKTTQTVMKLAPGTKKLVNGRIVLRKSPAEIFKVRGKEIYLKTRVKKPSFTRPFSSVSNFLSGRRAGQFKKFTKDPGLILKSQTVSSGAMPLSKQVAFAGREVTAVNASAQQLSSWLRRKKIIRKPIPGEEKFPSTIKKLLEKFDTGKRLTNKEFANVNLWLQKNVAPNITLLERSLYLDPTSGLRFSRLGIQPNLRSANIVDILRGNFQWKTNKPQVLIFEKAQVSNFPKSLTKIKNKLLKNQKLTPSETNQLIRWQVTQSGKMKPIGSTIYSGGKELEVTIAPGEYIKRIKQVGRIYIKGQKVTLVTAEIFKPSRQLINKLKLAQAGKLSSSQVKKLERVFSKNLGRKIRIETPKLIRSISTRVRREINNLPIIRWDGRGLRVLGRGLRRIGRTIKRDLRVSRKMIHPKIKIPRIERTKLRIKRITPRIERTGGGNRGGGGDSSKKPPIRIRIKFKSQSLSRPIPTYYVVEKVRGKFKKLYPKPLSVKDAKDYAVYSIDNRLSKTAFFVPMGKSKNVVRPPKQIQNYYSRNSRKVRPYRIRFGKKRQLVNGFIEKRKFFQDTIGEKRQLRSLRRRPKRIINSNQRRELLRRLKIARAVRMRNLRRRKR